jgi:hypothetical protein
MNHTGSRTKTCLFAAQAVIWASLTIFFLSMPSGGIALSQLPNCNGTNPTTGTCGTASPCANSEWQALVPTCVGNEIIKESGQFACTAPPNPPVGSTLCGDVTVTPPLVCTVRITCQNQERTVDGVTEYRCTGMGGSTDNSFTNTKKDNVTCKDTTPT